MAVKSEKVPAAVEPFYRAIVELTDAVCKEKLNDEYALLARQLTAALARKRPSPLARGKSAIWACGVVYALGTANFLFDKSQTPSVSADELCAAFGVKQSTGSNKAKFIRDLFDIYPMSPEWSLPSRLESNPVAWMIQVDGFIMDARQLPREIQEIAFEKGFIPYIPADRKKGDV